MKYILIILSFFWLYSCNNQETPLPILGNKKIIDGKTIDHVIRPFSYTDQDSNQITNKSLSQYVYVADFFFVSCPSICPRVAKEMLRVHDAFKNDGRVRLVSFTIDPKRDTIARLRQYASKLGVTSSKWHFLRGDKDFTLALAGDYFVPALEDATAPGGFDHSGKLILVDKLGRVRSFSEGTDPSTTPKIIEDIKSLLKEDEKK